MVFLMAGFGLNSECMKTSSKTAPFPLSSHQMPNVYIGWVHAKGSELMRQAGSSQSGWRGRMQHSDVLSLSMTLPGSDFPES